MQGGSRTLPPWALWTDETVQSPRRLCLGLPLFCLGGIVEAQRGQCDSEDEEYINTNGDDACTSLDFISRCSDLCTQLFAQIFESQGLTKE